jgi:hypothetical protein
VGFTVSEPAWLAILLLIIPTAWIGLRWFASMGSLRRWSVVAVRATLIALVAAMLAGLSTQKRTDRIAVIGVFDTSDSVRLFADAGVDQQASPATRSRRLASSSHRPLSAAVRMTSPEWWCSTAAPPASPCPPGLSSPTASPGRA